MTAAWEEESSSAGQQTFARERLAVGSVNDYDPFDEDDRLAQRPDDPFDEPAGESIPVPEPEDEPADDEPADDIDAAEAALEKEIKRRQAMEDLFQDDFQDDMEEPLDTDPVESDPLDLDDADPLNSDPLDTDQGDQDRTQPGQDDWSAPDFRLEVDPDAATGADEDNVSPEELEAQREELAKERRESEESCREELAEIEADRISSIDLSIRVDGNAGEDFPFECAVSNKPHEPRQWPQITYNWKAAALCHKPLYFEQVQLERYGHSWGPYVQPIMSGVHFFGTIPVLPYKMGIRTPCECVYTLGYYRPGSCAPYMIDPVPFTWRAAMFEGAAATGISFVIP